MPRASQTPVSYMISFRRECCLGVSNLNAELVVIFAINMRCGGVMHKNLGMMQLVMQYAHAT